MKGIPYEQASERKEFVFELYDTNRYILTFHQFTFVSNRHQMSENIN
ncbi:unnamed protein product [Paramecium pentaurelia]|uniref:Uncharacterized protein n=1 Tax=Paramecium pentaurelia TaxID=43138 RepID=A0A8S1W2Q5_9CILI|nr:unnamed protein product [Paramecium pentaurelia]